MACLRDFHTIITAILYNLLTVRALLLVTMQELKGVASLKLNPTSFHSRVNVTYLQTYLLKLQGVVSIFINGIHNDVGNMSE